MEWDKFWAENKQVLEKSSARYVQYTYMYILIYRILCMKYEIFGIHILPIVYYVYAANI